MDHFAEYPSNEDNGYDFSTSRETEAALYSLVHHSRDSYETGGTPLTGIADNYSVNVRNKALRWNSMRNLTDSSDYFDKFADFVGNNEIQDYMPLDECSGASNNIDNMQNRTYDFKNSWNNKNNRPWKTRGTPRKVGKQVPYIRSLVSVNIECREDSWKRASPIQDRIYNSVASKLYSPRNKSNEKSQVNSCSGETLIEIVDGSNVPIDDHKGSESFCKNVCESVDKNKEKEINETTIPLNEESVSEERVEHQGKRSIIKNKQNASDISISNKTPNINVVRNNSQNDQEIFTITDSEDNDSIIEVSVPLKPNPPLIALDSSDEAESLSVSTAKPILNVFPMINHEEVIDIHANVLLPNVSTSKKHGNNSFDNSVVSVEENPEQVGKRKKKKKKRFKSIECITWTDSMKQFYNQSWGGETFDHVLMQQKMTNNPSKWRILDVDRYGPTRKRGPLARVRCANCNQCGHFAQDCPDPKKIKSCFMCGMQGHGEVRCPFKMCLKCGRPAPLFNSGCPLCWSKDHPVNCTTCGDKEHFSWMCPNVWRKFHSVTTIEELTTISLQVPQLKPSREKACCFCAGQGHTASECSFLAKSNQYDSPTFMNSSFTASPRGKKRKKKRNSSFEWNKRQEFYRKKRKTN